MTDDRRPRTRSAALPAPDRSTLKLGLFGAGLIAAALIVPCGAHVTG